MLAILVPSGKISCVRSHTEESMMKARHQMPVCLALTLVVVIDSWAAAEGQRDTGVLDPAAIQPEKGCCYVVSVKAPCAPDSQAGAQSFLRLLEEGRELGPAHSMHETIRESGGGAYSHWAGDPRPETQRLYFSASDNSDPRTNGKKYEWAVVYDGKGDPLPLRIRVPPTTSCRLTTLPAYQPVGTRPGSNGPTRACMATPLGVGQ